MGLQISKPYLRNKNPLSIILADTAWHCISRDGLQYDTAALLIAAGKAFAGEYGFGAQGMELMINSVTNAGADASVVGFKVSDNLTTPVTADDADDFVSAGGQKLVFEGPFRLLWVKGTSGDRIKGYIRY